MSIQQTTSGGPSAGDRATPVKLSAAVRDFDDPAVQQQNIKWWQSHPMVYDNFRGGLPGQPKTREWYEEIDRRFFNDVASWFAQRPGETPFSALIPFEQLRGKRVLEIGCGSGAHARLLAQSGCKLTCIDITPGGVEMTRERLAVYGLEAEVLQMDAERLEFPDESFDFVWSWGVIHHSSNTSNVIRQIARVLRPGGETRLMVYHRRSFYALWAAIGGTLSGRIFRMPFADVLNTYADGALARFYTQREFAGLLRQHFSSVSTSAYGQKNELLPLPGAGRLADIKLAVSHAIPNAVAGPLLHRWGNFLWAVARK